MDIALATATTSRGPADQAWRTGFAPPAIDLAPFTRAELDELFRGGEVAVDLCETLLAWAARAGGALDVGIAEGLHALRQSDRLAQLGCHFDDYAREALDMERRSAENLARLGEAFETRPVLRAALRSGRVRTRAAQTVLPVAVGDAEARWVERAAAQTVRELEEAVRRARTGTQQDEDDDWVQLRTHLPAEERSIVDAALELAGGLMPGSTRAEQLEALAQEYLAQFSTDDADDARPLGGAFRRLAPGRDVRRARVEAEMERWAALPAIAYIAAPDVRFDDAMTAREIDETLRALARLRGRWDDIIGFCAHALRRSGAHTRLGFADFRQYVEERLQLSPRTVEQRAALEQRLWESAALQEARRQGVSYERLRVLARLAEAEIGPWIPRALAMTCVALRRAVEGERERQMRAQRKIVVPLPLRLAATLAAAIDLVRERLGPAFATGTCIVVIAAHFIETWKGFAKTARSPSQKVRERDDGFCQVPGCSRRAVHSHHVLFRSQGGSDEPDNQVALCAFHHLRCIHAGYLAVVGKAPDGLTWLLAGQPWRGPGSALAAAEANVLVA